MATSECGLERLPAAADPGFWESAVPKELGPACRGVYSCPPCLCKVWGLVSPPADWPWSSWRFYSWQDTSVLHMRRSRFRTAVAELPLSRSAAAETLVPKELKSKARAARSQSKAPAPLRIFCLTNGLGYDSLRVVAITMVKRISIRRGTPSSMSSEGFGRNSRSLATGEVHCQIVHECLPPARKNKNSENEPD